MDRKIMYNYSLLFEDFPNTLPKLNDTIRVICSEHGVFSVRYDNHLYRKDKCHRCKGIFIRGYWTKEKCVEDALNYKNPRNWKKNSPSAYRAAWKNNWLDVCRQHMKLEQKPAGYWTLEKCHQDAKQFKTKYEWQKNSISAYRAAYRNNWLVKCCAHMNGNKKWTKAICIIDAKQFKTKSEWQKSSPNAVMGARNNGWYNQCCAHMK